MLVKLLLWLVGSTVTVAGAWFVGRILGLAYRRFVRYGEDSDQ